MNTPEGWKLDPCPFCGGEAEFERVGTPRQSCIVACRNCGARHESSDENEGSGTSWNSRVAAAPTPPEQPAPSVSKSEVKRVATLMGWTPPIGEPAPQGGLTDALIESVLDDLKRAAARKWQGDPACQQAGLFARAADELDRLTRELDAARKDAGRYRWLRDGENNECAIDSTYPFSMWENTHWIKRGPKLDAAIDDAMSQEKRADALDRMARNAEELGLDY